MKGKMLAVGMIMMAYWTLPVQLNAEVKITSDGVTFPDGKTQTNAAAPFGVSFGSCMPTWHQILPVSERFQLVMNDEAVLDNETGLVWQRNPGNTQRVWEDACYTCYREVTGGRRGWRPPTVEELSSLAILPSGHPFTNVQGGDYWSISTRAGNSDAAWVVHFGRGEITPAIKTYNAYILCVRGGHGHDGR